MSSLDGVEKVDRPQRDETLRSSILSCIRSLAPCCTKHFAGRVVVVLDEAGGYPNAVRAVCSGRHSLFREVGMLLKATEVRLVVCGTGAEGATLSPGSSPESYHRIVMSSAAISQPFLEGEVFERLLTRCPPLAAVLAPDTFCRFAKDAIVQSFEKFPELLQMKLPAKTAVLRCNSFELFRQVMHNRRVAAVIVDYLATMARVSISNWFSVIPTLMQVGLLGYRSRNALSDQGADAITWGRIALSFALGGVEQQIPPGKLVLVRTTLGLICDNAQVVPKQEALRVVEHPVDMSGTGCLGSPPEYGLLAPTDMSCDDHLFHRYAMSGAMAAMISTDFGCDVRERSETGFEHAVGDAQYMWLLGSSSRRTAIAPLLPGCVKTSAELAKLSLRDRQKHAAHRLHELMRWMSCGSEDPSSNEKGPQDVFLIRAVEQLENVDDCWKLAVEYARWKQVGEERFIGAIIVNGPKASYADVISVYGQRNSAAPARVLLTQCKHNPKSGFSLAKCNPEFAKMCPAPSDSSLVKAIVLVLGGGIVEATSFRRTRSSKNAKATATPTFEQAPETTSDDLCAVWADDTTFNMAMHPMKITPWFCAEDGSLERRTELFTCVGCSNADRRLANE